MITMYFLYMADVIVILIRLRSVSEGEIDGMYMEMGWSRSDASHLSGFVRSDIRTIGGCLQ